MTEYITPPNEAVIDWLYAFMSIDENGLNGICASIVPGLGSTPLVFGKREFALKFKPLVQETAKATGKPIGLFAFKRDGQLWQSE